MIQKEMKGFRPNTFPSLKKIPVNFDDSFDSHANIKRNYKLKMKSNKL
jgi:hypothetical protein